MKNTLHRIIADFSDIYALFPLTFREKLSIPSDAEEIRLRAGRPVEINGGGKVFFTDFTVAQSDILHVMDRAGSFSLYAKETDIAGGFLTIRGGHRIGFSGRAWQSAGKITSITDFSSLNIRIARQIPGCAEDVITYLSDGKRIFSTLIISPPGEGKTTLLRDITRQLSGINPCFSYKTALVDTRGEIAACYNGVAQLDIGIRCDVLDAAPKADGFMLLIRSMSPEVMITDEIGSSSELAAISEVIRCGVSVIASAHGRWQEQGCLKAFTDSLFERYIFIKRNSSRIKAEHVIDREEVKIYG